MKLLIEAKENVPQVIQAYTIPQFCKTHGISRAFLYQLWQKEKGPQRFKLGTRTLISQNAARSWLRKIELQSNK